MIVGPLAEEPFLVHGVRVPPTSPSSHSFWSFWMRFGGEGGEMPPPQFSLGPKPLGNWPLAPLQPSPTLTLTQQASTWDPSSHKSPVPLGIRISAPAGPSRWWPFMQWCAGKYLTTGSLSRERGPRFIVRASSCDAHPPTVAGFQLLV